MFKCISLWLWWYGIFMTGELCIWNLFGARCGFVDKANEFGLYRGWHAKQRLGDGYRA